MNSEEPILRGNAVNSLSSLLAKQDAIEMLLQARSDPHEYVRGHAIGSLEKVLEEKDLIPLLIEALCDPHNHVRGIAAQRLTNFNSEYSDQIEIPGNTIKKLVSYVQPELSSDAVRNDVEVLGNLFPFAPNLSENRQLESSLLAFLEKDNARLKSKVVRILRHFPSKNVVENLIRLLSSSDSRVSLGAAESLKCMPTEVTTEYLSNLQSLYLLEEGGLAIGVTESIQSRCEFYNYKLAQLKLETVSSQYSSSGGPTFHFHEPVGIVNTGSVTIHGDQKGIN